jgi:hypothetical protein
MQMAHEDDAARPIAPGCANAVIESCALRPHDRRSIGVVWLAVAAVVPEEIRRTLVLTTCRSSRASSRRLTDEAQSVRPPGQAARFPGLLPTPAAVDAAPDSLKRETTR